MNPVQRIAQQAHGDPNNKPNPVLGTIAKGPFHGMQPRFVAAAVGNSGVHIDVEGRVLHEDGSLIAGLHAVGSCTAQTVSGTGYNSGIALGCGLAMAYLVIRDITGAAQTRRGIKKRRCGDYPAAPQPDRRGKTPLNPPAHHRARGAPPSGARSGYGCR